MQRNVVIVAAMVIGMATSAAHAHHSHPYTYDFCKTVTVQGRIERVDWKNPHTEVLIKSDDGAIYTVDWAPLSALMKKDIAAPAQAALVFGARVSVTGNPIRTAAEIRAHFPDFTSEVNPRTIDPMGIRRVDNSFTWMQPPPALAANCGKK